MFHHRHRGLAALLLSTAIAAQTPQEQTGAKVPPAAQALIDEFIRVMPREPAALRQPALRRQLAPSALPVLRQIRDYAAVHQQSQLAGRVSEFVVYALVLDEPDLHQTLAAWVKAGDRDADLLVRAADVIKAGDAASRGQAMAACAEALATKADGRRALDAGVASCAVQCLIAAGDLSEAEARQLAGSPADEALVQRLRAVAERAARDPRRLVDQPFEIEGTLLGGKSFRTGSLKGKVVLIDFWATWCAPCVRALPDLVRLQREHRDGLAIVGVSCDREEAKLKEFLAGHPEVDWPQLFPGDGARWHPLATQSGVESIPRLFLVDRKGVLRSADATKDLAELVRRYLAE